MNFTNQELNTISYSLDFVLTQMKDEDLQDNELNETLDSLLTQTKNLLTKIEG